MEVVVLPWRGSSLVPVLHGVLLLLCLLFEQLLGLGVQMVSLESPPMLRQVGSSAIPGYGIRHFQFRKLLALTSLERHVPAFSLTFCTYNFIIRWRGFNLDMGVARGSVFLKPFRVSCLLGEGWHPLDLWSL